MHWKIFWLYFEIFLIAQKCVLIKKVLLPERTWHTDRGVSSTPSVVLSCPGWGTPLSRSRWGTPSLVGGGVPHPWGGLPQGTPHLDLARVPPIQGWMGVPSTPPPPSWTWPGYPPRCGLTKWKYNLPSRTTYAVGNKVLSCYGWNMPSKLSYWTKKGK